MFRRRARRALLAVREHDRCTRRACIKVRESVRTHTRTHARTHACTRIHEQAHTCIHIHTRTR